VSRLGRFEEYRFIGTRDDMRVYDCDDPEQFEHLRARVEEGDLLAAKMLQAFSPDTLIEAANRGFRAASG
jgi:hypothetical protein